MFAFLKTKDSGLPPLRFHNTLSGKGEDFESLKSGEVKMYNCGPTVYGTQHIGNMSAAVFADVLRRTLEAWDYQVKQVINITDFGHLSSDADEGDDKMTIGLRAAGMDISLANMRVLAERYTEEYFADLDHLGIDRSKITFPRASDFIPQQISLIESLEEKGYAYKTSDGVYFDVSRFKDYGKLGQINLEGLREGARVKENTEKRGPFDFILWKSDDKLGWESPWGLGFPGWHIECTAMIFTILGKQIDIHTGGVEHIPVHHNNEIAQAEAATGKQFSKFWLHRDHITIDGKKISKSLGNTIYVHNIIDRGINPRALRYWFLTAHYRTQANFTWDALTAAQTALTRLQRVYLELKAAPRSIAPNARESAASDFKQAFLGAMGGDLDTPAAIALVWDMVKDQEISATDKLEALTLADTILGLGLSEERAAAKLKVLVQKDLPKEVQKLIEAREEARKAKDFAKSDELRNQLEALGYSVKDTPEGQKIFKE
ncbi:MAG: cysteinyl-tRNA synthetase [Patescibacteria group bacterium]|nr:cysteinyl-tRNA synthetase [Patescibacteria group bacterium]